MSPRAPISVGARRRAVVGWVLFDWAAQPFFTLVTTFIYAPYLVVHLAGDPVFGQSLLGYTVAAAGLLVAAAGPVCGALADGMGPRKPWIAAASVLLVFGCAALWLPVPGGDYALALAVAAFIVATLGAELATIFTNAMLPDIAAPGRLGRMSGLGWAVGYVGGLIALAILLVFFVASEPGGRTLAGIDPLFGLGAGRFEGERLSGPFSALWYFVFVLPLFAFVPDRGRVAEAGNKVVRRALKGLGTTLARLVEDHGPVGRFLLARMIYQDGLSALFAFGGAYAAAVFSWRASEVGLFGIVLIIAAALGAWAGGYLDDRIGSRRLVLGALAVLIACVLALLSVGRGHVLFVIETAPATDGALFGSLPEIVYLVLGSLVGMVAGPVQSASRALLVRISPAGELTEYFGLYALSGKVTVFAGPLLIGLVTALSGDLRLGFSVILVFFVLGAFLLARVPAR